ncbi:putative mitogen-activated protein kinase kinase TTK family [Helianthus annuus]|uniref:Mitogen-activated protein kinase kinase TTK family n=1 Tax=Helianthus annuus TaxID=4232 RepID=A0A9K3J6R6_HELAN|nr:serine/threonine-protein kinase MPS1 isoform X2 [Helianthus annuus]KAF5809489.1 putative mitogen-activated protein kinase kinase TTK family [Helianthus annuus]
MDTTEADLPPDNSDSNFHRSFNATTTSSSSSSPPDFLRNVQAAFKRHRMIPQLKPRRLVVRGEPAKSSDPVIHSKTRDESHNVLLGERVQDSILRTKNMRPSSSVDHEDASITPPTILGETNDEGNFVSINADRGQHHSGIGCTSSNTFASSVVEHAHGPLVDGPKKVQFALQKNARSHGSDDHMTSGTDNLLTHMNSLALTEMEWVGSNQSDVSYALSQDTRLQNFQKSDADHCLQTNDERPLSHLKSTIGVPDQIKSVRNFIQSDFGHNMTQSSVVGSSCATTTIVNPEYAPMLTPSTHCSRPQHNSFQAVECSNVQDRVQPMTHVDQAHLECSNVQDQPMTHVDHGLSKDQQGQEVGHSVKTGSTIGDAFSGDITDVQSQAPIADDRSSNVKTESHKHGKKKKADANKSTSKRNYDPDLFFKVNGKLYQRLGKIGSGGSSEVHKVISQDCTIYALKKIKLKGRDYATAYGFCQEIEYLNKLKGMDHIIQLIDYEVTDKGLLKEVMSGSLSNKDGKVKDDGYIYMVLEYGEIDLAHMLSQKWKELDKSKLTLDENWLRFYWQQILLAVKTIHEERIVHSDLKPANFLLVRGSLKLIDFGIAKAIMSDTTNIQRDSQVGTLSYMSPEAYMCNETDAQGNIIKCGRPSDIWSLGCILYQMVYGRTPFADYKTFWAKFKVVTDPDHQIPYEPLSNPWLLDLMKKCLAWDRNQRWRIPQLLQHPFLVPPVSLHENKHGTLVQLLSESFTENPKALMLCTQLEQLLRDPLSYMKTEELVSLEKKRASTLLDEMSKLCCQLKEELATSELDSKR